MSQQINLFNPALRPKKEWLTADLMVKAMVGFAVVLGAYGGYLAQQTAKLMQQRDGLARQVQLEQDTVVQLVRQFPARTSSKALQDEIVAAQEKVHQRQQVFKVLESGVVGSKGGFSGLMQAFAHQGVNGLWLTGFSANGAGDQMRINGRALSPDMIPEYIGKLSAEQALRGRTFTALQVSQPKQEPVAATPAGQQKPGPAALPAYIEFALSAEKATAANDPAKAASSSAAGAKS